MKIFIIIFAVFLGACSSSLIEEDPSKALEYAYPLLGLKMLTLQLKNELQQAEDINKKYWDYEENHLPNLIKEQQVKFINDQNKYLDSFKLYENRVAKVKKENEEQRLSVEKYNNFVLSQYNVAKTKEETRVRHVNKLLQEDYAKKINDEMPNQKKRINKMKAYEKEQLEASYAPNVKTFASLTDTVSKGGLSKEVWTQAFSDLSAYMSNAWTSIELIKKTRYEQKFRDCIDSLSMSASCKQYVDMSSRGVLVIPKLYSKKAFDSALAINHVPKVNYEVAQLPSMPELKKLYLLNEPVKPAKPLRPKEPKNPFLSQAAKISKLKSNLLNETEKFLMLNDIAIENNLDVDWDNVLQEVKESGIWKISEEIYRKDALIAVIKNNI